jgi:hypothetical protein
MSDDSDLVVRHANPDVVQHILNAVADAIIETEAAQIDIIESICQLLKYNLSGLCLDCRKRTLEQFEKLLPVFADDAARVAASYPGKPSCSHH